MKGFIAGLGVGALIGIGIAPKAGAETRRELLRRADERLGRVGGAEAHSGIPMEGDSLLTIINDWPESRLIEIDGIGPVLALKIIENRPYKKAGDLTEIRILPPSAVEALRQAAV